MEPASVTSNNQIVLSLDSFASLFPPLSLSLSFFSPSLPSLSLCETNNNASYIRDRLNRGETVVPFPGTRIIRFARRETRKLSKVPGGERGGEERGKGRTRGGRSRRKRVSPWSFGLTS